MQRDEDQQMYIDNLKKMPRQRLTFGDNDENADVNHMTSTCCDTLKIEPNDNRFGMRTRSSTISQATATIKEPSMTSRRLSTISAHTTSGAHMSTPTLTGVSFRDCFSESQSIEVDTLDNLTQNFDITITI